MVATAAVAPQDEEEEHEEGDEDEEKAAVSRTKPKAGPSGGEDAAIAFVTFCCEADKEIPSPPPLHSPHTLAMPCKIEGRKLEVNQGGSRAEDEKHEDKEDGEERGEDESSRKRARSVRECEGEGWREEEALESKVCTIKDDTDEEQKAGDAEEEEALDGEEKSGGIKRARRIKHMERGVGFVSSISRREAASGCVSKRDAEEKAVEEIVPFNSLFNASPPASFTRAGIMLVARATTSGPTNEDLAPEMRSVSC